MSFVRRQTRNSPVVAARGCKCYGVILLPAPQELVVQAGEAQCPKRATRASRMLPLFWNIYWLQFFASEQIGRACVGLHRIKCYTLHSIALIFMVGCSLENCCQFVTECCWIGFSPTNQQTPPSSQQEQYQKRKRVKLTKCIIIVISCRPLEFFRCNNRK